MFDSHCHLVSLLEHSSAAHQDLSSVLLSESQFLTNPKNYFLCVSTRAVEWSRVIQLHNNHSNIYAALGIHPWFVDVDWQADLFILNNLILNNEVAVIGEVGLDFSPLYKPNREQQIECFAHQLLIAEANNKPVSLHVIKAHNETLNLLKSVNVTGVIHGIGTSIQMAQAYIDLGYKLGVNGVAVRENAMRYHKLISHFGIEHIVLETDYPNIRLPYKDTSHLADIFSVAQFVANKLDISLEKVITITENNTKSIFKLINETSS